MRRRAYAAFGCVAVAAELVAAVGVAGAEPAKTDAQIKADVIRIVDEYKKNSGIENSETAAVSDLPNPNWAINVYKSLSKTEKDEKKLVAAVAMEIALEDRGRCETKGADRKCAPTGSSTTKVALASTVIGGESRSDEQRLIKGTDKTTNRQEASKLLDSKGCGPGKWSREMFQFKADEQGRCAAIKAYATAADTDNKKVNRPYMNTGLEPGFYMQQALTIVLSGAKRDRYVELGKDDGGSTSTPATPDTSARTAAVAARTKVDDDYLAYKKSDAQPTEREANNTGSALELYKALVAGSVPHKDLYGYQGSTPDPAKTVAAIALELAMTDRSAGGVNRDEKGAAITLGHGKADILRGKDGRNTREEASYHIKNQPGGAGWKNLFLIKVGDGRSAKFKSLYVFRLKDGEIQTEGDENGTKGYHPGDFMRQALTIYHSKGQYTKYSPLTDAAGFR